MTIEELKIIFSQPPYGSKVPTTIHLQQISTPLGHLYAGATDHGICFLEFTDRIRLEAVLKGVCQALNGVILPGHHAHLQQVEKELNEYFGRRRKTFEVPLHMTGTPFQQKAWNALIQIPYGFTRSYKEQAATLQKPEAIRAVGTANGQNKIAIVIPCHRLVGSNGSLNGYAGGIVRKDWLLKLEKEK